MAAIHSPQSPKDQGEDLQDRHSSSASTWQSLSHQNEATLFLLLLLPLSLLSTLTKDLFVMVRQIRIIKGYGGIFVLVVVAALILAILLFVLALHLLAIF
jgi:hypothetical protein